MPICKNCNNKFPNKINIDGEVYNLSGRKFCLDCSPLGSRNTRSYIVKLEENESFCIKCNKIKNKSYFHIRKNGRPFSYCIECQEKVKKIKFEEKMERIIEMRGGVCYDCGFIFPTPVFEFYSDSGIFHISRAKNMSLERIIKDLDKYIMICKNCSAIRKWEKN